MCHENHYTGRMPGYPRKAARQKNGSPVDVERSPPAPAGFLCRMLPAKGRMYATRLPAKSADNGATMTNFSDACRIELWRDFDESTAYPNVRPLLAHYTTLPVLEKIVMNDELWFSHPLLMNDSDEMRWGLEQGEILFKSNENLMSACGSATRYKRLLDDFSSKYIEYTHMHAAGTYVACFCRHNEIDDRDGILSMWRGYGGNGSGVALIFDTQQLNARDDTPFVLAPIEYLSKADRTAHITAQIDLLAQTIKLHNPTDEELPSAGLWFMERLKLFALFTKHNGFNEEKEWRLAYMGERDKEGHFYDMLGYFITERGAQPKLKVKIGPHPGFKDPELSMAKLAHSILLGPSLAGRLNQLAIERLLVLAKKDKLRMNVRVSGIPYRA
jgi:hypothetical protein